MIEELKREIRKNDFFRDREIDDADVLSIVNFLKEKKNCIECKKNPKELKDCPNFSKGYEPFVNPDNTIYYCKCPSLLNDNLEKEKEKALSKSFMPKQLKEASIDGIRVNTDSRRKCLKFIVDYLNKKEYAKGAYIYGDVGVGKTYILAALANELNDRGICACLVYFPELVNEVKNNFDLLTERINFLKEVDVLIIDDFGVGNMTQWVRDSILSPILNYRMLAYKPVFMSSNIKFGKLLDYLKLPNETSDIDAARLCRRISELCESISL